MNLLQKRLHMGCGESLSSITWQAAASLAAEKRNDAKPRMNFPADSDRQKTQVMAMMKQHLCGRVETLANCWRVGVAKHLYRPADNRDLIFCSS